MTRRSLQSVTSSSSSSENTMKREENQSRKVLFSVVFSDESCSTWILKQIRQKPASLQILTWHKEPNAEIFHRSRSLWMEPTLTLSVQVICRPSVTGSSNLICQNDTVFKTISSQGVLPQSSGNPGTYIYSVKGYWSPGGWAPAMPSHGPEHRCTGCWFHGNTGGTAVKAAVCSSTHTFLLVHCLCDECLFVSNQKRNSHVLKDETKLSGQCSCGAAKVRCLKTGKNLRTCCQIRTDLKPVLERWDVVWLGRYVRNLWGRRCGSASAVHVGPAGGVLMEVILAQARRVVGSGEHVAGGQRRREVVARLFVDVKIVFVEHLQSRYTEARADRMITENSSRWNSHTSLPWTPWGCTSHSLVWHYPAWCRSGGWGCWDEWLRTLGTDDSGGGSRCRPAPTVALPQRNWPSPQLLTGTR